MKRLFFLFSLLITQFSYAQTKVHFVLTNFSNSEYQKVGIRGNTAPLSWDTSTQLIKDGNDYKVTVEFPQNVESIEFKFVLFNNDKKVRWENIENRSLTFKEKEFTSTHTWNVEDFIDPKTLTKLTIEELQADYAYIEEMVLKVHPGTYRYNNEQSIQEALSKLKGEFSESLTHGEAYLAISELLATIKCDHTFASYYNQNGTIKSVIHRQKDKVPFTFRWIEGKMVVEYDVTENQQLGRGTEIVSINSEQTTNIQKHLLKYIKADGGNDKSRITQLEVNGFDLQYDAFDVFHPLVYPVNQEELILEVKRFGSSSIEKVTVEPITREARFKRLTKQYSEYPSDIDKLWSFETLENKTGILTLSTFSLYGWGSISFDYKEYFAEVFEKIKKENIENLIIDIRLNTGGNDEIVQELMTYFPIPKIEENEFVGKSRYQTFPEALKPVTRSWGDPWYYQLSPDRKENGYFIHEKEFEYSVKNKIKKNVFKGKTYLLTSSHNVSLAFYLSRDARKSGIATLVGRETGGNLNGINGGQILFLKLPNSQIEIDVPIIGSFAKTPQLNQGVLPDIYVEPKLTDFAQGVDTELEKVKQLIANKDYSKN